ncbi:hypothetical protein C8R43DRAFT_957727 [Mycena crocata]|nr:hypothetical protein C8R43DRAFT_957727 [Mycena crocata]
MVHKSFGDVVDPSHKPGSMNHIIQLKKGFKAGRKPSERRDISTRSSRFSFGEGKKQKTSNNFQNVHHGPQELASVVTRSYNWHWGQRPGLRPMFSVGSAINMQNLFLRLRITDFGGGVGLLDAAHIMPSEGIEPSDSSLTRDGQMPDDEVEATTMLWISMNNVGWYTQLSSAPYCRISAQKGEFGSANIEQTQKTKKHFPAMPSEGIKLSSLLNLATIRLQWIEVTAMVHEGLEI